LIYVNKLRRKGVVNDCDDSNVLLGLLPVFEPSFSNGEMGQDCIPAIFIRETLQKFDLLFQKMLVGWCNAMANYHNTISPTTKGTFRF
jgi:hypothetical protein